MHVVGHQTVGVDRVIVPAPVATEPLEIGPVVGVIEKRLSPLVATDDDMVEQAWGKQSGSACHDPHL